MAAKLKRFYYLLAYWRLVLWYRWLRHWRHWMKCSPRIAWLLMEKAELRAEILGFKGYYHVLLNLCRVRYGKRDFDEWREEANRWRRKIGRPEL